MRPFFPLLLLSCLAGCPGSSDSDAGTDTPARDVPGSDTPTVDSPSDAPSPIDARSDTPAADAPGADAPADCTAQDARPMGDCDLVLGVAWLGTFCGTLSGCTCAGTDCGALYTSLDACGAAHRACPRTCGGLTPFGSPRCLSDEFCDYPMSSMCGGDDSPGDCQPRPTECLEPGGVPICGCDGNEYMNDCLANMAGTDRASFGDCPGTP